MNIGKFSRDFIALGKKLKSYFKPRKFWSLKDYPVLVYPVTTSENQIIFQAQIINWSFMVGTGETDKLALDALLDKFDAHRAEHGLPRPGSKVPVTIRMPSREEYEKYYLIRLEFFDVIKDITLIKQILLTTQYSKLPDYRPCEIIGVEEYKAKIIKRVRETYGIDVTDNYDGPLHDIFDMIMNARQTKI